MAQPAGDPRIQLPRAADERRTLRFTEPLVVFVPHDTSGTLAPWREQRQRHDRHIGVAPHSVREPAPIAHERDGAAAAVAQSQNHGTLVERRDHRVYGKRRQRLADAERFVFGFTFSERFER
jgi:hypothetical protein